MQNDLNYIAIQDLMTEDDRRRQLNPPDQEQNRPDTPGALLQNIRPGMIVKVGNGMEETCKAFVLSIDRKAGTFCALPVFECAGRGRVYIEVGKSNIDYNGKTANRTTQTHAAYIDTQHITTDSLDYIQGYDVDTEIQYSDYLDVLNKVIESFNYDEVVEKYDKYVDTVSYNKFSESAKRKDINLKQALDPKTILIQNLQKQVTKLTSELQTARAYKESSKQDVKTLKTDYTNVKADLMKSINAKEALDKQVKSLTDEKTELEAKYHDVLEKYATATRDPKVLEENQKLQEDIIEKTNRITQSDIDIRRLTNEATRLKQDAEKAIEQKTVIEQKLRFSEDAMRQLSEKHKRDSEKYKAEIQKKDKIIEKLKKEAGSAPADTKIETELRAENESLRAKLASLSTSTGEKITSIKEYTLRPNRDTDKANVTLPSVVGYKLKKLLEPVPEEYRADFLDEMIGYMEDSIKQGTVTINMLTRLTWN